MLDESKNNELDIRLVNLLKNSIGVQQTVTISEDLSLRFKFNGENCLSWAKLIKKAIGSRGGHNTSRVFLTTICHRSGVSVVGAE